KAAIAEGIVTGGGTALAKVADKLGKKIDPKAHDEYTIGYRILLTALSAPLLQIAKNAGREDGMVILREVIKKGGSFGYDASGESDEAQIVDMFEAGIIDPVKVTRSGVENAASAAAVLLTTDVAVADIPEEKKESGGGMPGGMGME
ncbi:chaperonin GroEL, partial [Candidatus Kaiserbacteria bacterium]|nr:chaperonin GroEL [Candidatus Kaiserbacteria bacterium]